MTNSFFIVGIGASAGGVPALTEFFDHLPYKMKSSYVVATHLMRDRQSLLDQILKKHTKLPVIRLEKDTKLEMGKIYVIIEDTTVTVKDGLLKVEKRDDKVVNSCVDILFESLAIELREIGIGIILSGGGNDGLKGAKKIKEMGGKVLVQNPDSAKIPWMPMSVIEGDHPIIVETPAKIAQHLVRLCKLSE
ncbi:chemotaxis protein CheB [Pedobacter cryoconitis]|nr:chemotaxis protein CheB [Pedobacter cryoconitis]